MFSSHILQLPVLLVMCSQLRLLMPMRHVCLRHQWHNTNTTIVSWHRSSLDPCPAPFVLQTRHLFETRFLFKQHCQNSQPNNNSNSNHYNKLYTDNDDDNDKINVITASQKVHPVQLFTCCFNYIQYSIMFTFHSTGFLFHRFFPQWKRGANWSRFLQARYHSCHPTNNCTTSKHWQTDKHLMVCFQQQSG